jgi:predicted transcriptional regulator
MKRLLVVALSVFALCAAQAVGVQAQAKSMSASGTVKSVSGSSLVITGKGGKDMTFTVDNSTKFVGKGLGTKAKAGNLTATDAVAAGDRVSVSYHDMGGTMHAASVRVTAKASPSKSK